MARVKVSVIVATRGVVEPSPSESAIGLSEQTLPAAKFEVLHCDDRTAGIGAARGDYVLFLDPPDRLGAEALEHITGFAERNELDIVVAKCTDFAASRPQSAAWRRQIPLVGEGGRAWFDALVAPQVYRRAFLLEHDIRFADDHPLAQLDFNTRAWSHTRRIGVLADCACYTIVDHDRAGVASPRDLRRAIEASVTAIVDELPPGEMRDELLVQWYRHGILELFGPRYAKLAAAKRERVDSVMTGVVARFPPDLDRRLDPADRARSVLLRAGSYGALLSLSRVDAGLQLLPQEMTATWHAGRLHLAVNGVLAERDGTPMRFGRSGAAVRRVLPADLLGTGADTVDLAPDAARAVGEFIVRARGTHVDWVLSSTSTLEFVRSGTGAADDLFLRFAIEGQLDPAAAAGDRRLDDDVWDVFYRVDGMGWTETAPAPAPEVVPPPALVDGISLVPYPTKGDTLAVDVGDTITTLVAFAGPRLRDAVIESEASGSTRTRVALPDVHTRGVTSFSGTVSIGSRVVPAQLTGVDGSAALVIDTARLATARSIQARFGGRWSAPLFAAELAALAAIRTASAKTPKRIAEALRHLPTTVDGRLTASDQVRLAHARSGHLQALAAFNRIESGLQATARETSTSWQAGQLQIIVRGVLTERGGAAVRFSGDGDAIVRVLPPDLAAPSAGPIDIRPDLTAATGAITVRARESNARWAIPATVRLEIVPQRATRRLSRDLNLLFTLEAWLDPDAVADGGALGDDVWDVAYRVDAPGWTTTSAAVPAPALDVPTALVDGVRLVLYPTQRNTLALDTGDKIRTLIGYALPRLADATVEANGNGSPVTRITLPNTYVRGDTELVGALTVDEREVPARIIGSGGRAVLVAETSRLARAEAVSGTFGGRESFPLFAYELPAGRGAIARMGIATVPPARRLRERAQRIGRRIWPRR